MLVVQNLRKKYMLVRIRVKFIKTKLTVRNLRGSLVVPMEHVVMEIVMIPIVNVRQDSLII
jgi:hypothetical protein